MVTEDIIRKAYIDKIVSRDQKIIRETQAQVIASYLTGGTGRLLSFVKSAHFSEDGLHYNFPILNYLRFLDIKNRNTSYGKKHMLAERKNLALYNRVVWGVLYNETLPDIKYGLTQDIRDSIRQQLQDAGASGQEQSNI